MLTHTMLSLRAHILIKMENKCDRAVDRALQGSSGKMGTGASRLGSKVALPALCTRLVPVACVPDARAWAV